MLGLAFKPNIGDTRESPSIEIAKMLQKKGASLRVHDPIVESAAVMSALNVPNLSLDDALRDADCVVITTDHDSIRNIPITKIRELVKERCVLVDTRNVYDPEDVPEGLVYRGIGRIRF